MNYVTIIGGGLAGCEATWQLVSRGIPVHLYEMRPHKMTKAHKTGTLAELVCSNSFRGAAITNAVGLLKEELRRSGSLIFEAANFAQVPAGGALAVDRVQFSNYINEKIRAHPLVTIIEEEQVSIPSDESLTIIATGPLTSKSLSASIRELIGVDSLSFFDAISPILYGDTINHEKIFRASRYDKGDGADYLNIPMDKEQYYKFVDDVLKGEKYGAHDEVESDCIDNLKPFEGCMPIEEMASRGIDTLLFGPLKPVGLNDPKTGKRPHAVMQLRQDNKEGTLWSMVGMQTRLKRDEQIRIFRSLPGLEEVEFVRLGSVHRNSFINSPKCLNPTLQFRSRNNLFFAGQITGVEGYVESTAGGLVAGINAGRIFSGKDPLTFPIETAIGSLMHYISDPSRDDFQPMNISFGLMPSYFSDTAIFNENGKKRGKDQRRELISNLAIERLAEFLTELSFPPHTSSLPLHL